MKRKSIVILIFVFAAMGLIFGYAQLKKNAEIKLEIEERNKED